MNHTNLLHIFEEFQSFLPEIAARAGRYGRVEDVNIGCDTLHFHALHKLKGNIGSTALLHTRHGSAEDNNILLDPEMGE